MIDLTGKMDRTDNSKIKEFKTCPRKFFYNHVLGWRSINPNNHLVFGSALHEAMEYLLLTDYSPQSVLEAYEKFLTYYRKFLPPETDEMFKGKTPDKAFERLAQYASFYKRDHDEFDVLFTEIAGSVAIDNRHLIYFRQDAILQNKRTGRIRSREHKTGSGPYLWAEQWALDSQVCTYNHALNCIYPEEQVDGVEMNGCFFPSRKSPPKPEDVFSRVLLKRTDGQMQTWMDNTRYYFQELEREFTLLAEAKETDQVMQAFPLRDTSCLNYFRLCEYHDFCMAWPNPLRKCFEPPIGFKEEFWDPTDRPAKKTFQLGEKEY